MIGWFTCARIEADLDAVVNAMVNPPNLLPQLFCMRGRNCSVKLLSTWSSLQASDRRPSAPDTGKISLGRDALLASFSPIVGNPPSDIPIQAEISLEV